jgi:beta-galactosidase GanA
LSIYTEEYQYSIEFDNGEKGETLSLYYEALSALNGAKSVAKYADGEYVKGYSSIIEREYGKGKIVYLSFLPDEETFLKILSRYTLQVGVEPIVQADKTVFSYMRQGEKDYYFTAVETGNREADIYMPFDGMDMITGRKYKKSEKVEMKPFSVVFVKQNRFE